MRVMTLNVLMGGEDRMDGILAVVRRERPDVLVLQECLEWEDGRRLGQVAEAMGVPGEPGHAHLGQSRPRGSGRRYHVAVLSRRPMASVRDHNDPARVGHCIVEARIGGLTVYGTHFDASGEDPRVVEARYLGTVVDRGAFGSGDFVLAGDLNALSPRDPYPADLAERVRRAGTDKYGHPPRFDTIRELEGFGWVDALRVRPPGEWVTARRNRGGVRIDYRTDYVFVSPALAGRVTDARVVPADGASDHEGVVAELEVQG